MIRPAGLPDVPALTELWQVLGNTVTSAEMEAAFTQMSADPAYATLVYVADDRPVGFVTLVRVLAVGLPQGYLKINGLAVLPAYQGRGIGRQLMAAAEQWGRQRGLSHALLNSGIKREQAHGFYRHLGYDRDSWCFDKRL